jgi:hypothetical protein
VGSLRETNGQFHVRQRRSSLLDKDASCICKLHNALVRSIKQQEFVAFFKSNDLFGESRLADVQFVSSSRETQLLSNGDDRTEKACFDIEVHCSRSVPGLVAREKCGQFVCHSSAP